MATTPCERGNYPARICALEALVRSLLANGGGGGSGDGGGGSAVLPDWINDLDTAGITINGSDELEIVKDGVTYWIPLNRR